MYQQGFQSSVWQRYFLAFLNLYPCWNWTEGSEQSSGNSIDIGGGERLVLLDQFSVVCVGSFKRSFNCHSTLLVNIKEAHFEIVEWAASYEKDGTKEELLREVSNNDVLKASLG